MRSLPHNAMSLLAATALLAACDSTPKTTEPATDMESPNVAVFGGEWSEPVLLDEAVNSPSGELGPELSPDRLSLYFNSNRPLEGFASFNIWVSQRACLDCPWQPARPLPAPINGTDNGGQATLSRDGHLLFFLSNREGSEPLADGSGPSEDIWMATRKNPTDDFGWENPVRPASAPGCESDGRVNTEQHDQVGGYVVAAPGGNAQLYFTRAPELRIYRVTVGRDGNALDCAEPVTELGQPGRAPSVRADGRELIFWAPASRGGRGASDLWVSARRNVTDPWTTPVNLGAPINSPFGELDNGLSHDGTTLVFSSGQARGGLGLSDIWIATRKRGP